MINLINLIKKDFYIQYVRLSEVEAHVQLERPSTSLRVTN